MCNEHKVSQTRYSDETESYGGSQRLGWKHSKAIDTDVGCCDTIGAHPADAAGAALALPGNTSAHMTCTQKTEPERLE